MKITVVWNWKRNRSGTRTKLLHCTWRTSLAVSSSTRSSKTSWRKTQTSCLENHALHLHPRIPTKSFRPHHRRERTPGPHPSSNELALLSQELALGGLVHLPKHSHQAKYPSRTPSPRRLWHQPPNPRMKIPPQLPEFLSDALSQSATIPTAALSLICLPPSTTALSSIRCTAVHP